MTQTNDLNEQELVKFPRTCSLTNLLDMDYMGPISQILSDGSYNSTFEFQINTAHGGTIDPTYAAGLEKYNVKQNSSFGNQVFDQRE